MKKFEIDTLMLVAAAGAAALGAWAEGALLLFLFSLGHALEHYAMGRAKKAIEALAKLAPETATVRRGGQTSEIRSSRWSSTLPSSARTSACLPTASSSRAPARSTRPRSRVKAFRSTRCRSRKLRRHAARCGRRGKPGLAGTINGGAIEIEVTRRSNESALAKVVKMVSEAETQKSPTQRFTDRFERIFVPAVLILSSVLLLFAWVVVDEPFRDSFYRAMAVLVAASPARSRSPRRARCCRASPRARRRAGEGRCAARKSRVAEGDRLRQDGTLTEGRPRITDVVPVDGADEASCWRWPWLSRR
jgi:Cd2+/Zn2+-exporting ATPase